MIARGVVVVTLGALACSDSGPPAATSGPIGSIVHVSPTAVQLYAVRHRLELAELPIDDPLGLPISGTIELSANVMIPLSGLSPALRQATGRAAVRCVGHCQLGDDHTKMQLLDGEVDVSHIDLSGLAAQVEIKGGVARLTQFALASTDLELQASLEVRLAKTPGHSELDGCLRFRPTAALAARDPRTQTLVTLMTPGGADGWYRMRIGGTVDAVRLMAGECEPQSQAAQAETSR